MGDCSDDIFGVGSQGSSHTADCGAGMVGYQVAQCKSTKQWEIKENNCALQVIQNLKSESKVMSYIEYFSTTVKIIRV